MRSVISAEKRALLSAELETHRPDIVALTETGLDDSVEVLDVPGYNFVSRRDRVKARTSDLNNGGIALYSRGGAILVAHLEHSLTLLLLFVAVIVLTKLCSGNGPNASVTP